MSDIKRAAILGASGYTGAEAIRLIQAHPRLELAALTGHSRAGQPLSNVYPNFAGFGLPDMVRLDAVDWDDIDVAFACLPHGASQESIAQIIDKVKIVIDLSADFRLKDPALYAKTYNRPHAFTDLLPEAVYGLTEYARPALKDARLIACPGCYPTCSLLSLLPAVDADIIELDSVIIDAKSGVTGAGRKVSEAFIFSEIHDGAHAYGVAKHRHAPEIDQMLSYVSGESVNVSFTPHLIPMNRGMITTIYAKLKPGQNYDDLRSVYADRYADEPFIYLEADGQVPQTRHVRGSNQFRLGLFQDRQPDRVILIGVIDNLTKGSSGQAVQNYNVRQGWDETLGLTNLSLFP